jgi:hypothetical protein
MDVDSGTGATDDAGVDGADSDDGRDSPTVRIVSCGSCTHTVISHPLEHIGLDSQHDQHRDTCDLFLSKHFIGIDFPFDQSRWPLSPFSLISGVCRSGG